jgi:1,2-diacylglycerol 3-beta-glucosyltransferase
LSVLFGIIVSLLAVAAVFSCGYLLLLTLLSGRNTPPVGLASFLSQQVRFDVIVPAHNEAALIERTVANLLQLDWPKDSFRVIVVADNCTDDTTALARAAGAHVIERRHDRLRGKGYALEFAFHSSQSCGWADALVVVDADSEASPNLLSACAARIVNGAQAVQVYYSVRDPHASWRTRLMCIALAAFHRLRSRARERLHVSCGIRGNGWCVTQAVLKRVPYKAFSLAEDIEYGILLGIAGFRVHYADEATVAGEMVSDAGSAGTQRQRWEQGRFQLVLSKTMSLVDASLRQPSKVCFDLAMDLLVLPISYIALNVAILVVGALLYWWWEPTSSTALWLAAACVLSLALYVLRGWQLSGMGMRGLMDLARAPFFIAWKIATMSKSPSSLEWVRTKRRA